VLAAECAGVPVVGEEYGIDHGATTAPYRWVVDPVDGTADYVAGLPWFAYSLALLDARGRWSASSPTRVAQIHAAARGRGVRANGVAVRPTARAAVGRLVCSELGGARAPGFTRAAVAAHTGVRVLAPRSWRSPA
jgi:myo-inositol-1(or 4)-monophosphatase